MSIPHFPHLLTEAGGQVFLVSGLIGGLVGCLIGGLSSTLLAYIFGRRLFTSGVMDQARKDVTVPLSAYVDWLTTVAGEISLWKIELLPSYLAESSKHQFELNRMRKLFVDQRSTIWLSKLEEYDTLLSKFNPALKAMWIRQMEVHDAFTRVFTNLEFDSQEALSAGKRIETLVFEQSQLVSDLLYHLQYECLKSIATAKPRSPKILMKPRIIRTAFGRIRLVTPKESERFTI